jgi:hypothetical protein
MLSLCVVQKPTFIIVEFIFRAADGLGLFKKRAVAVEKFKQL